MRCSRQSGQGARPSPYWKYKAPRIAAAPRIAMTIAAPPAPTAPAVGFRILALAGMARPRLLPPRHSAAARRCRLGEGHADWRGGLPFPVGERVGVRANLPSHPASDR